MLRFVCMDFRIRRPAPRTLFVLATICAIGLLAWIGLGGSAGLDGRGTRAAARTAARAPAVTGDRGPDLVLDRTTASAAEGRSDVLERVEIGLGPGDAGRSRARFQLVGRVTDAARDPIAGARVLVTDERHEVPVGMELDALDLDAARLETASDGGFGLGHATDDPRLRPGRGLDLLVRFRGFVPSWIRDQSMSLTLPHDVGTVALEPAACVSGRVTDPSGAPVAGARVLFGQAELAGFAVMRIPTRGLDAAPTDEDGRFFVDELRTGPFHLIVIAEGFVPAYREGAADLAHELTPFDIRLERGLPIGGRVLDSPDPLGLCVEVRPRDGRSVAPAARRPRVLMLDGEGAFRGEGFVANVEHELRVRTRAAAARDRRRVREVDERRVRSGATDVVLTWHPRASIRGRVVFETGSGVQPLESYIVSLANGTPKGTEFDARPLEEEEEPKTRHPGGEFVFDGISRRRGSGRAVTLRVRAAGFADHVVRGERFTEGEVLDLGDLIMSRADRISARVIDASTKEPIRGAGVYAASKGSDRYLAHWTSRQEPAWESDSVRYGETDGRGYAHLPGPAGGAPYRVAATAEGYCPSEILPLEDVHADTLFELVRGATVLVRVTGPEGEPVPRATVGLRKKDDRLHGERNLEARTDANGEVRFRSIPAGAAVCWLELPEMQPRRPIEWRDRSEEIVVPEGGSTEVALSAPAAGHVSGVVLMDGRPVRDARLTMEMRSGNDLLRPDFNSTSLRAMTASDGRFHLPDVPAGAYEIALVHESRAMVARFPVSVEAGENDHVLRLLAAEVEGRVVDQGTGEPLENVTVFVSGPGGSDRAYVGERVFREEGGGRTDGDHRWEQPGLVRTRPDGRFRFVGVAIDTELQVRAQGQMVQARTVRIGSVAPGDVRQGVEIAVRSAGVLRVHLESDGSQRRGRRGTQVTVQRLRENGERARYQRQEWGRRRADFNSLPPGRYRVTTRSGDNEVLASGEVTIEPRRRVEVTLAGR